MQIEPAAITAARDRFGKNATREDCEAFQRVINIERLRCAKIVDDWAATSFPAPESEAIALAAAMRRPV